MKLLLINKIISGRIKRNSCLANKPDSCANITANISQFWWGLIPGPVPVSGWLDLDHLQVLNGMSYLCLHHTVSFGANTINYFWMSLAAWSFLTLYCWWPNSVNMRLCSFLPSSLFLFTAYHLLPHLDSHREQVWFTYSRFSIQRVKVPRPATMTTTTTSTMSLWGPERCSWMSCVIAGVPSVYFLIKVCRTLIHLTSKCFRRCNDRSFVTFNNYNCIVLLSEASWEL